MTGALRVRATVMYADQRIGTKPADSALFLDMDVRSHLKTLRHSLGMAQELSREMFGSVHVGSRPACRVHYSSKSQDGVDIPTRHVHSQMLLLRHSALNAFSVLSKATFVFSAGPLSTPDSLEGLGAVLHNSCPPRSTNVLGLSETGLLV